MKTGINRQNNQIMNDKNEISYLENILTYGMSQKEAKAYKISCIYKDLENELFPEQNRRKSAGDPRKSLLFKYCMLLLRETEGLVKDDEYSAYIRGNMEIIKYWQKKQNKLPTIIPNWIVGERALNRWYVWRSKVKKNVFKEEIAGRSDKIEDIKRELLRDKKFLDKKAKNKEELLKLIGSKTLFRWMASGMVSKYYGILSPLVAEWLNEKKLKIDDLFIVDLEYERSMISGELIQFFKEKIL